MTLASEKLSQSLFHSRWSDESQKFKVAMKIFMENTKEPLVLTVFGVFGFSLETFQQIINVVYKFYAVLKNL